MQHRLLRRAATFAAFLGLGLAACGGANGGNGSPATPATSASSGDGADPEPAETTAAPATDVKTRTVVEKTPNGTRTTTITTRVTRTTVEAPSPPPRPADPLPGDPLVAHNVAALNAYRKAAGVAPLLYDAKISAFALDGSKELARDHKPHAHFAAAPPHVPGMGTHTAENQGDPNGVPAMSSDRTASGTTQIDLLLKLMMDEGPGGGHHDNMLNPRYRRVGIGLYLTPAGALYLTNDFSD